MSVDRVNSCVLSSWGVSEVSAWRGNKNNSSNKKKKEDGSCFGNRCLGGCVSGGRGAGSGDGQRAFEGSPSYRWQVSKQRTAQAASGRALLWGF